MLKIESVEEHRLKIQNLHSKFNQTMLFYLYTLNDSIFPNGVPRKWRQTRTDKRTIQYKPLLIKMAHFACILQISFCIVHLFSSEVLERCNLVISLVRTAMFVTGEAGRWSGKCKFFCVYRPYKESFSKEMNNDNDLNLHLHDQLVSGWLRC